MPASRYYYDGPLKEGEISLDESESHHLEKVMRTQVGEQIEVVNGKGSIAHATVTALLKKEARAHISRVERVQKDTDLFLAQAIPQQTHLEFIVEKGVELGMSELILFQGDKSVGALSDSKLKRLEMKKVAALKQSGRLFSPKITFIKNLTALKKEADFLCYGDLSETAPLIWKAFEKAKNPSSILFCSGPESGFSSHEIELLKEKGYKGVSLHTNILRCESAPLAFLSLAHQYLALQRNTPIVN